MCTVAVHNSAQRIFKLKGCLGTNSRGAIDWPNFPRTRITLRANRSTNHFEGLQAAYPTVRSGRSRQARQNRVKVLSLQSSSKIFDILGSWRGPFRPLFGDSKFDSGADTPPKFMPNECRFTTKCVQLLYTALC